MDIYWKNSMLNRCNYVLTLLFILGINKLLCFNVPDMPYRSLTWLYPYIKFWFYIIFLTYRTTNKTLTWALPTTIDITTKAPIKSTISIKIKKMKTCVRRWVVDNPDLRYSKVPILDVSANSIIHLARCLPRNKNYRFFYDNYYKR